MKTLQRRSTRKTLGLIFLATCASSLGQVASAHEVEAEPETQPFAMTVIKDRAYGYSILRGSFNHAIDRLSARSKALKTPESATNLCVAYVKAKELDKAMIACNAAVLTLQSKKNANANRSLTSETLRASLDADLSVALSNQGVLFAVTGEDERARENFMTAIELDPNRSRARENLIRLNSIES